MLSIEEARSFYDRFGAKQDQQGFYEDAAVDELCRSAGFREATAVLELGCGTGKLAHRLLEQELGPHARYLGLDLSTTMVRLARERTAAFGARAEIRQTDGSARIDAADGGFDRFVSCYVLDLLSHTDIHSVLAEAHRVLAPGGLLCTAGLTPGRSALSRVVSSTWAWLQARAPHLVGGCRPIEVQALLPPADWEVEHKSVVQAFGVPSEVLVARRR